MNIMEQIARLEQELQAKRSQLQEQSGTPPETRGEKELLHEVVGEKLHAQMPTAQSPASGTPLPSVLDDAAQAQVDELVGIAFGRDLDEAIRQAAASGNPAIVDAFHDTIVDELYDEMITQKKISPVP